jgi:hypothetical protein
MSFDPQIRAQWQARTARLLKQGYRAPIRLPDNPRSEKLDRSTNDERPVLFGGIVPLRNTIHARVISRQEVDRRLLKLMRPRFSLAGLFGFR